MISNNSDNITINNNNSNSNNANILNENHDDDVTIEIPLDNESLLSSSQMPIETPITTSPPSQSTTEMISNVSSVRNADSFEILLKLKSLQLFWF
jgi:hypothetical protein